MKKSFLSLIAIAFLVFSCDDGPKTTGAQASKESPAENLRKAENDGHSHNMSKKDESGVPALPEVPADAKVFFANLEDGAAVKSPLYVEFGIEGMEVEPAGKVSAGKGHHHIIIDADYIETGGTVPANETNIHYGGGQTGDTLELASGKHTLTMQFADGLHRSYGKQMSATITVNVE